MAQGHRIGGCFRCGNPHHSQWECREPLEQVQISGNRKLEHESYYLESPNTKKQLGAARMTKLFAKKDIQEDAESISWDLISNQVDLLIDFFLERETKLESIKTVPIGIDGNTSSTRAGEVRAVHGEIQNQMENARLLIACGKVKSAAGFNQLQLEICRGNLANLGIIRGRVFAFATRMLHSMSNLDHSISDFNKLREDILKWCSDFTLWANQFPPVVDLVKLDDQLLEKRINLQVLENRARYIHEIIPSLEPTVAAVTDDVKGKFDLAISLRNSLENRPSCCPICGRKRVEVSYSCGHRICRYCNNANNTCRLCNQ